MTKVLITGATGNVGSEVLLSLNKLSHHLDIYGAVRNPKDQILKRSNNNITFIEFDFTDINTYKPVLQVCEILFLLRPLKSHRLRNTLNLLLILAWKPASGILFSYRYKVLKKAR